MEHYFEEIRNHDPVKPDLEKSSDDDIRGDVLCNLTNLLKADMNTHYFPFISDNAILVVDFYSFTSLV